MGSSIDSILPAVAGGAASLIPGVGPIVAPLVGGVVNSMMNGGGGGGSAPTASGGGGTATNPLMTLAGALGPGAAQAIASGNQALAKQLMDAASTGTQGNLATGQANLGSIYNAYRDPSTQNVTAPQINTSALPQVTAPQLNSVYGSRGLGSVPQINAPSGQTPMSPQTSQLRYLQAMLGSLGLGGPQSAVTPGSSPGGYGVNSPIVPPGTPGAFPFGTAAAAAPPPPVTAAAPAPAPPVPPALVAALGGPLSDPSGLGYTSGSPATGGVGWNAGMNPFMYSSTGADPGQG